MRNRLQWAKVSNQK